MAAARSNFSSKISITTSISLNFITFAYLGVSTAISMTFVLLVLKDTQGIYIILHAKPVLLAVRDASLSNSCNAFHVTQDLGLYRPYV